MNLWFKSHNINNVAKKRFRHCAKPFWNDELFYLWKKLCEAESNYLSRARRALLATFKQEQNTFDKSYRNAKCKFECDKRINIERLNSENPGEFWHSQCMRM